MSSLSVSRNVSAALLLAGLLTVGYDAAQSFTSQRIVNTSFGALWLAAHATSFDAAKILLQREMHPLVWTLSPRLYYTCRQDCFSRCWALGLTWVAGS